MEATIPSPTGSPAGYQALETFLEAQLRPRLPQWATVIASLETDGQDVVALGDPPDEEADPESRLHNCDQMGCGQQHVLARFGIAALLPDFTAEADQAMVGRWQAIVNALDEFRAAGGPQVPTLERLLLEDFPGLHYVAVTEQELAAEWKQNVGRLGIFLSYEAGEVSEGVAMALLELDRQAFRRLRARLLESVVDPVQADARKLGILRSPQVDAVPLSPRYPTPDEINELSEPAQRYIHDLETRCDPAGELQERAALKDQVAQLSAEVEQLRYPPALGRLSLLEHASAQDLDALRRQLQAEVGMGAAILTSPVQAKVTWGHFLAFTQPICPQCSGRALTSEGTFKTDGTHDLTHRCAQWHIWRDEQPATAETPAEIDPPTVPMELWQDGGGQPFVVPRTYQQRSETGEACPESAGAGQ